MSKVTVFRNGSILTQDAELPQCPAILVNDGRIAARGSEEEILALAGKGAKIVDLDGGCLLPGFVEAHGHVLWSGMTWGDPIVDIRSIHTPTYAAAIEKIKRKVAKSKPGEFIMAVGLDPIYHAGLVEPTRELLDEIAPNNPLAIVFFAFHQMWVNEGAVKAFGLHDRDDLPPHDFVRNEKGDIYKLVEAASFDYQKEFYKLCGKERALEQMAAWTAKFARAGYTTCSEMGMFSEWSGFFAELTAISKQPVRLIAYERAAPNVRPQKHEPNSDLYRVVGTKFWADGSIFVGNISLSQPYMESDLTKTGLALKSVNLNTMVFEGEVLRGLIEDGLSAGVQISVHTQGDTTVDRVLEFFEELLPKYPDNKKPHRLEHCTYMLPAQVRRAHKLGLVCSFFSGIGYNWGSAIRNDMIGPERGDEILPAGTAAEIGMRFSIHCDSPMTWPDALGCVQFSVTRQDRNGAQLGSAQKISVERALRAVTIDAAYQLQMDDKIGSIEVGKYADLVWLKSNPLVTAETDIMNIPIVATYLAGEEVKLASED